MKWLRRGFALVAGGYAAGVTGFLVLRTLLGDRIPLMGFIADFTPFFFAPLLGLLPASLILRSRAALWLLAAPSAIGALLIGRWYLPKTSSPPSPRAFTVVNYNVLFSNPHIVQAVQRLAASADILVLEELPYAFEHGIEAVRAEYPYQRYADTNAILSRYPFDPSSDGISPAVVLIDGQPVVVYAVHAPLPLSPGVGYGMLEMFRHYSPLHRDVEMAPMIDALRAETRPFIVVGDFNMTEFATLYGRLAAVMTDSYREVGTGLGFTWSLMHPFPTVRIDYVWHSPQFRAVHADRDLTPSGSDHAPLSVMLDWR